MTAGNAHQTGGARPVVVLRWMSLEPAFAGVAQAWPLLDAAEQARAERFRVSADRDAYIAAHALLRLMLSEAGSIAPGDWRFRVADTGKPAVDPALGQGDLLFSLSHTRGMAACAVGRGHDIGVDVDRLDRSLRVVELAQRMFAPGEAALIAGAAPARQTDLFYRIWTLKEAYLKATGEGVTGGLDRVAFALDPPSVSFGDEPDAWQFAEFSVGPGHRLAVAIRCPATSLVCIDARGLRTPALPPAAGGPGRFQDRP